MGQFGEDLNNALKAVSQQSIDEFSQIAEVFGVRLPEILNLFESNFRLEGAKVLNEMKMALEECKVGAHREVASCLSILFNRLAEVGKIDVDDTLASDALLPDEEAVTDVPLNVNKKPEESPSARLIIEIKSW